MVALRFASLFLLSTSIAVLGANLPSDPAASNYLTSTPPSLGTWAETRLTAIIKASSAPTLNAAFDAFLAQDVKITLNNKPISRADYISERLSKGFTPSASINYTGSIAVPAVANSTQAGLVALFFRDHVSSTVESAMNLVIASGKVSIINQIALGL
ncbi:hypothetical protein C8F04DRAFT_1402671 [Mycena alexandri]|uniref:Uncharacterized protein n=1 Tax=Mycena alexandri TaxID=1745969 RepID=A0AAD6WSG2_9AGAR|nr:hypothetical protein C8F04DRAFT_1402671 [Mycena alexandri]